MDANSLVGIGGWRGFGISRLSLPLLTPPPCPSRFPDNIVIVPSFPWFPLVFLDFPNEASGFYGFLFFGR